MVICSGVQNGLIWPADRRVSRPAAGLTPVRRIVGVLGRVTHRQRRPPRHAMGWLVQGAPPVVLVRACSHAPLRGPIAGRR
jgi:hypothetical protein